MINQIYQLINPKMISIKYEELNPTGNVLIRPEYMSICHADRRYYFGTRPIEALRKKLPMALIHECCGVVVSDETGTFSVGEHVVMIPNTPVTRSDIIYENYVKGAYFLSSGHDGFMRELVAMPAERVVRVGEVLPSVAAITEFVSVCVHAASRMDALAHPIRESVGIWGDGSLSFALATVLRALYPNIIIKVIGKHTDKLSLFSFVDEVHLTDDIPADFAIDHAFECTGGTGCEAAIDDIIRYINPQGCTVLMGVSENNVPIYTRNVLEKGLTFVGASRSGRADFERAVGLMSDVRVMRRLSAIITEEEAVSDIAGIHRVFQEDTYTPFKTVFKWNI